MINEEEAVSVPAQRRLGRLPMKTTRKALLFSDFFKFVKLPPKQEYWTKKTPLPLRTFGNTSYGCCTIAKQAVASMRMERIEQRKLIDISDEEVIRVYLDLSERLYGGGDNGAYEDDALTNWRDPTKTFRDAAGHPYTIDAFLKINAANHDEMRAGLVLGAPKGIAICLNLPAAFARLEPPAEWHVPAGNALIGEWMPGSWGGHSLFCNGYNSRGLILDHTWGVPNNLLTWEAAAAYCDEAHLLIDSVDTWRKKTTDRKIKSALSAVTEAVNSVSAIQIVK